MAVATPNETCQPRASLEIVALRTMPPSGQDSRNRTQPSFGSRTSAHLREHLRTSNGLARKRYREAARTPAEGGCLGGMLRAPPVVVGTVELAEDLLRALGGQIGKPRQVRAGVGEVAALLGRPDRATTLTPGEPALLQCQIPHRPAGVPPAGQPFCLPRGRIGAVPPASVSVHSDQYPGPWDRTAAPVGSWPSLRRCDHVHRLVASPTGCCHGWSTVSMASPRG